MDKNETLYYAYSDYLKNKYGEKVYKLPVNLPVSCPNRTGGRSGCSFCAECGTGFEAMEQTVPVKIQLTETKEHIESKYHAHKFIAYFQNYTNTFLPVDIFEKYMKEALEISDIVGIDISTRPDCIRKEYLDVLKRISEEEKIDITIELGLQTVNYHTLAKIERGHSLAEFIDAVLQIKKYNFMVCAHVILNLPGDELEDSIETAKFISALGIDIVKIHSLYIAKNTRLCDAYENGTITLCSKEEYIHRLIVFLEYLDPDIVVERLFSRVPQKDAVFSNWNTSWWKLRDEVTKQMTEGHHFQGRLFHYLNGAALEQLQGASF
ncbi:MAG: TIGR01212 family radical SAM protein [Lachnospiraceae bacterium]